MELSKPAAEEATLPNNRWQGLAAERPAMASQPQRHDFKSNELLSISVEQLSVLCLTFSI